MNNITVRQYYIGQSLPALIEKFVYKNSTPEFIGKMAGEIADHLIRQETSLFNRTGEIYRQGDVLIARIDAIPPAAFPFPYENNHAVLAHGEVTGHKHQLVQEEARLFACNDNMFLRILTSIGYVQHEEHSTIQLVQGDYQVIKQREASDKDDQKAIAVVD